MRLHSPMKHLVSMDCLLYADYSWRRNCFHINSSIKVDVSAFKSLSVFWCGGIFIFESTRFGLAYDGSTTLIRLILIKPTYIEDFQFSDKSKGLNILKACFICHVTWTTSVCEYNAIKLHTHLPLHRLYVHIFGISKLQSHKESCPLMSYAHWLILRGMKLWTWETLGS